MIKVAIIAGSTVSQTGIESVLRSVSDFEVVSAIQDSRGWILELNTLNLEAFNADVLFIEGAGTENAFWEKLPEAVLKASGPFILVLTHASEQKLLWQMLAMGIHGILPYTASTAEIIAAVRAVAAGLVVFHADFQPQVWEDGELFQPAFEGEPLEPLTAREQEVLTLLSQGISNRAIATQLHLSEHTVKFHLSAVFTKLRVSTRTEAVAIGIRQGLIML